MTERERLQDLIEKAKQILDNTKGYTTEWNRLALQDMVRLAEEALSADAIAGTDVPFTRKREYWKPDKESACRFAARRYTMVPTYLIPGKVYHTYGLADAIEWFRGTDLRRPMPACEIQEGKEGYLTEEEKQLFFISQCRALLEKVAYGKEIGQYDKKAGEALEKALAEWERSYEQWKSEKNTTEGADTDELAHRLTYCIDCMEELCFSRVLRSEVDSDSNLLMTAAEMDEIREKISCDPIAKSQYEQIQKLADSASLEERRFAYNAQFCPDDYELLNRHFTIQGGAGNLPSFRVPEETSWAELSIRIPEEEKQKKDGPEMVHFWNIGLKSSNGEQIRIPDDVRLKQGSWTCDTRLSLSSEALYTFTFDAKQDGKYLHGADIILTFFDAEGNTIGDYKTVFNRKSWIDVKKYNLYLQCDAICYWYTGKREYAEKGKIEMLHFLDDFLQGAEHWLVFNSRPEGSDAYGAVQGGRDMFTMACAYSLMKDSGVFSKEEKDRFYQLIDYFLRYLSDLRDRTILSAERAQRTTSNWQTDMCIGTAAMMMVLTDFPNRKHWIYNAEAVLRAQLELRLNPDGSWPESIRYHHATLEHFALYARMWLHESGINWFTETRLPEMFDYTLNLQTPPYDYFNRKIATPPFGDHKLGDGSEFAIYGLYCGLMEKYQKDLADRMRWAWEMAGKPVKGFWGESVTLENLMYVSGKETQQKDGLQMNLSSCAKFTDAGIYVFRKNFGKPKQNYLAVMSSPKKVGHGHLDQGSFILYYHGVPVVMDSGVEGYFDSTTPWHLSSYSHAVMQFATKKKSFEKQEAGFINLSAGTCSLEHGWSDGPDHSRVKEVRMGGSREWISVEIENPEGFGMQTRTISMDHESEECRILDKVSDFTGEILFSLPLLMRDVKVQEKNAENAFGGTTLLAEGYYGVNLNITFNTPLKELTLERGRATAMEPDAQGFTMLWYVRAKADAKDGFDVALAPVDADNQED